MIIKIINRQVFDFLEIQYAFEFSQKFETFAYEFFHFHVVDFQKNRNRFRNLFREFFRFDDNVFNLL